MEKGVVFYLANLGQGRETPESAFPSLLFQGSAFLPQPTDVADKQPPKQRPGCPGCSVCAFVSLGIGNLHTET